MRRQLAALCRRLAVLLDPAPADLAFTVLGDSPLPDAPRDWDGGIMLHSSVSWSDPLMWTQGGPRAERCKLRRLDTSIEEREMAPSEEEGANGNCEDGAGI